LVASHIETLPTAQATNSTGPTGGVMVPMPRFRISMTPKCTGSMPMALATGRKIGVPIMMSGAMSMKVPSSSRTRLIRSSVRSGSSVMPRISATVCAGTCKSAISQPKDVAVPMISMTMPVVRAAPPTASVNPSQVRPRYTAVVTSAA
jgi:hypothetical protein